MTLYTHIVFSGPGNRNHSRVLFSELKGGTWFKAKRHNGSGVCAWVKRNCTNLDTNAFSPRDGSAYSFNPDDEIEAVFNVNIRLEETH